MSKGSEALKRIKTLSEARGMLNYPEIIEKFDIVETALKDYEKRLALAKEYSDVNNVAKRLTALEIIKELVGFDFAIRFGSNQPMLMITNKRTNEYWEIPLTQEKYNLFKDVML